MQCRINNNSKCSNCYGPHAFGGPTVLCAKFVLYYMQGWILEFSCSRQALKKRTLYFAHSIPKLYSLKARYIFHFVSEFASAWKSISLSHCKSFEVILFYTVISLHIEDVQGPLLAHLHIIFSLFWQTYDLLQNLLKVSLEQAWAISLAQGQFWEEWT